MRRFGSVGMLLVGMGVGAGVLLLWLALGGAPSGLIPVTADEASAAEGVPSGSLYTCSMHPEVVRDEPGQCPICGMALTPLGTDPQAPTVPETGAALERGAVRVSEGFLQNFGIRTDAVEQGRLAPRIRTVGYLDQNEESVVAAAPRIGGWIERARVNTVGERVEQGDLLFEIYSPELIAAQREYLAATEYAARLRATGAYEGAVERADALLLAARERLGHWGLAPSQIERLEEAGRTSRTVEFFAPASGYVVETIGDSLEGLRLEPGATALKIADHSVLWAKVEFYERHVRDLRPGLRAIITLDAYPDRSWRGRILFFRPAMNPRTQTLTGYVEVANGDGLLRPKMYATVEVALPSRPPGPIVPAEAVLHSGERSVVIVDRGNGFFAPREVALGLESDGRWEVLDGLSAGERVVTSSQFLIDSESNLRSAVAELLEADAGGHRH